jgi:hypothetical protein
MQVADRPSVYSYFSVLPHKNVVNLGNDSPCVYAAPLPVRGQTVTHLVEALCSKPAGRGFDSRRGNWIFQFT